MKHKKVKSVNDFTPEVMKLYGELIGSSIPEGVGFGLVLFDGGEGLRGFRYISNCSRDEMFECFQSLVAKWREEKRTQENN